MTNSYLKQNAETGRVVLPDLVRAFALFGIAVVNVAYFANPMGDYNLGGGVSSLIDKGAYFAVNGLFLMKSYTLFSFMFGVGFAYQITSAQRQSASFDSRYFRRIVGLFAFGLINVAFLFQGDILVFYAILGVILYAFKDVSPKNLNRWAIALYTIQIVAMGLIALIMWAGETYAPDDMAEAFKEVDTQIANSRTAFSEGSFIDALSQRFAEWGEVMVKGIFMQGWSVLAFFLFGLSAVKTGIIHQADHPIWKKFRRFYLPIGIVGSLFAAWVIGSSEKMFSAQMFFGLFLITLFAPFSTAGYLGLIAKWANGKMAGLKTFFARGGTSSLTAYLMQGLILSLIFNAYGLGYFGKLGAGWCILVAAGVGLFTIAFASLWRLKFKRGPLEVILRRWTYLKS